jgi:hypothetical protein
MENIYGNVNKRVKIFKNINPLDGLSLLREAFICIDFLDGLPPYAMNMKISLKLSNDSLLGSSRRERFQTILLWK